MKLKAVLKDIPNSIKWLEIETDELDTKGAFLYYKSDNECFDTWHVSLEDALLSAKEQYGVIAEDWFTIN
jgi:hypothetical protein